MTELEFAALLVSRVCHDLVGPLGAVVNGIEVMEEEHEAAVRSDALGVVASSAEQALRRLQFLRLAFGAAGAMGGEVDLYEVGSLISGWFIGTRIEIDWKPTHAAWPKTWSKLVMNAAMIGADCLPRGGRLTIETPADPARHGFDIVATGSGARISEPSAQALRGDGIQEGSGYDARGIQPVLAWKLARSMSVSLRAVSASGHVEILARPETLP